MCGIVGISSNNIDSLNPFFLDKMSKCLKSRGPDDSGVWFSKNICLAHRRLSIQDISKSGHQPMKSFSSRYVIVFNGEIYNHLDLRRKIVNHSWNGLSDTETILAYIESFGIKKALVDFIGMFAFALYDKEERDLYLCRDRIGEKPLYYYSKAGTFLFSSDIKSFYEHPAFKRDIDLESLDFFLRKSYCPPGESIFENTKKVLPGTYLKVCIASHKKTVETYWDFEKVISQSKSSKYKGSYQSALTHLKGIIHSSVKKQLISDVPIGCFLSGGIDSSLIASIMQNESSEKIKTFSIGFDNHDFNEATYAKDIAKAIGSEHNELYIDSNDVIDIIPKIPEIYSEPFADSSQLPTYILSNFAQKKVKVALSGDGGDEIFAGYNRYIFANSFYKYMRFSPKFIRHLLGNILSSYSPKTYKSIQENINKLPGRFQLRNLADKSIKISNLLKTNNYIDYYETLTSHIEEDLQIVQGLEIKSHTDKSNQFYNSIEYMMFQDSISYLPDDILVKVDRAAMANSLETRAPFLDHELIEFVWSLPINFKIHHTTGKKILKDMLGEYLDKSLFERPKMGFGVPISDWLRGPLNEWANFLLSENELKKSEYLNTNIIRKKWSEHESGRRNHHNFLWNVLMFQSWKEMWK